MSTIITCVGEDNMGVSTTTLSLGKQIADLSNKKVLLVDLNFKKPDINKILSGETSARYNIDIVMNYAITESNLEVAVTTNVEKLKYCNMQILMGTNSKGSYDEEQYINFFNTVVNMYDFIIIDTVISKIPQIVIDYSDNVLLIVDQSRKNLINIYEKYWKIIKNDKTEILINRYENGVLADKKVTEVLEKAFSYKIRYDKKIVKYLNQGNLALEDTDYTEDVEKIAKTLMKRYGYIVKNKSIFSFFRKGGKKQSV